MPTWTAFKTSLSDLRQQRADVVTAAVRSKPLASGWTITLTVRLISDEPEATLTISNPAGKQVNLIEDIPADELGKYALAKSKVEDWLANLASDVTL
ncbi:hypothetical protein LCGC14_1363490 [marine sediment metagenome]|uniref:Uncharacterized protein n=1 Tax=marine sediment metagenome TaxID=412755 RepID=A0A0F9K7X6_9ZZZZ